MLKFIPIKEYYDKAQRYLKKIDELSDLIRNKTILSQDEKRQAQAMMKILKDELKKDCEIGNSVRKMNKMTLDERQLFVYILEANEKLNVRTNSHPIRSNWSGYLGDCRNKFEDYVEYLLSRSNIIGVFLRSHTD
jgi:mRNA-degrading endonuclease YafQ of YafQ-DinJ toxin-antitoxin module